MSTCNSMSLEPDQLLSWNRFKKGLFYNIPVCNCEFWQKIKVHKKCAYFTKDYYFREDRNPKMRPIPVGGDQLTCERIRGAHMARLDGDSQEERLEGLTTMVEDFHEKMNFLQVMY